MFGRIVDIEIKPYEPPPGVGDLAELFTAVRQRPYAMLLLSGGDLDCAGYSLMGWDPFLVLRARGAGLGAAGRRHPGLGGQPLHVLEDLLGALELPGDSPRHAHGRRRAGVSGLRPEKSPGDVCPPPRWMICTCPKWSSPFPGAW